MRALRIAICALAAATVSQIAVVKAHAGDNTTVWSCQDGGLYQADSEPLGDREGHSLMVVDHSCRAESGLLAGGVMTYVNIWEWDGPKAVLLTQSAVIHKFGATLVFKGIEGNIALTMTDGKVTGWTSTGRFVYVLATGDWASLNGKSGTWKSKSVGPGSQFSCETTAE
jgi:hypothetical protein